MRKESGLSESEKESFQIEKFIFHIIIAGQYLPTYLEEVSLTDEQQKFFKQRFGDISEGSQFVFTEREHSLVYKYCKQLYDDPDVNFLNASKEITALFNRHHNLASNSGVFITALVSVKNDLRLIFLIKLDHRTVYQYRNIRSKALLEEIKNTFVEDKKAIQKAALIDISDYYKWDVLATDRTMSSGDKLLSDYFYKFLEVTERETPGVLTEMAMKEANKWAINNRKILPQGQDPSSYKARAAEYLMNNPRYKTSSFIDYVINSEDLNDDTKTVLRRSFRSHLNETSLAGQTFIPFKAAINKAKRKNVRKTVEGIKIEWEGDANSVNLTIPKEKADDGLYHIVIKTAEIIN